MLLEKSIELANKGPVAILPGLHQMLIGSVRHSFQRGNVVHAIKHLIDIRKVLFKRDIVLVGCYCV
jgi:hypothetical protein